MGTAKLGIVLLLAAVLVSASSFALAAGRVALVVGNGMFAHIGRLPHPANDATDVSAALGRPGFEVTTSLDAGPSMSSYTFPPIHLRNWQRGYHADDGGFLKEDPMERNRVLTRALVVLLGVAYPPAAAYGQSQIVGQVTDNTGGVVPGVTVEAASPVLIEGSRISITDSQGRYGIVDLRPGDYEVTFTLPGFSTVVRDQLALPANFAMTIDVEMLVGALEETITVSGEAPLVDVQQAQRSRVIRRDVIDAVPTGRSWQTRVALMPGVQTTLDIGGSRAMDQHYIQTAGLDDDNTSVTIDGMLINGLSSDGGSQYYLNDAFTHEMAVEMSGPDAETSSGGVLVTMIPREGGNELSGTFYYEAMNRDFTSSNLTPRLTNHGVRSVDRIDRSYEVNGSLGGPVVRDRVWFFYTGHRRIRDRVVLDSFHRDGSPGIDDRQVHGNNLRFTIQATRNNKLSVWYDRNNKLTGHNHTAGEDVETVSESRGLGKHGPRYAAQVKWTSTISSRMLSEVGWSTHRTDYNNRPQPGLPQDRPAGVRTCLATPCLEFDPKQVGDIHPWYSIVSRFDPEAIGIERMGNAEFDFGKVSQRYVLSAKLSYVTGSHNFKVGVQNSFGPEAWTWINNADIRSQDYRSGVPEEIRISNTPLIYSHRLNHDIGLFAQESWTLDRLTLSPGIRLEWFNGQVDANASPAGRWVPARQFDEITNLPDWFDVSLRFGVAYDLFGRRADGAEVQRGPLHGGDDGRLHRRLQPAEPDLGVPRLAGLLPGRPRRQLLLGRRSLRHQWRRHRPGLGGRSGPVGLRGAAHQQPRPETPAAVSPANQHRRRSRVDALARRHRGPGTTPSRGCFSRPTTCCGR